MESSRADDPFGALTRAMRVIVVVDVVESVRLLEQDELGVIDRWRRFVNEVVTEVLPQHGGRLVKSLGDGMLLEFAEARGAVGAASDLHRRIASANAGRPAADAMLLRIGAHRAEVVADGLDVYGAGVNLAARVATLAGPGETIVTPEVRDQIVDGLDAALEDLGECHLKHVQRPVRCYRIGSVGPRPVLAARESAMILKPAVAVIPPLPRRRDPAVAMLGELVADRVIAALSQSASIDVISRLTTSRFRGRSEDARRLGEILAASYILSGAYEVHGTRLVLQAEVCDARSGRVVWAGAVEGEVAALAMPDDALTAELASHVSEVVVSAEVRRAGQRPVPTLESYTLLIGAVALMHRASAADFARARTMLEHLIDRNPAEPLPRAWMAKWYGIRAAQGWTFDPRDDARAALVHVSRALDTDPDNSLAWTMKGLIHGYIGKDLDAAGEAYAAALAANPSESLAWLYTATLNAWQDRGADGAAAAAKALRLSPYDPLRYYYDSLAATALIVAGDLEGSVALAERSLRSNRAHASTYRTLAIAHVLRGQSTQARAVVAELMKIEPELTVAGFARRYPGRASRHAATFCAALREAGVPE